MLSDKEFTHYGLRQHKLFANAALEQKLKSLYKYDPVHNGIFHM